MKLVIANIKAKYLMPDDEVEDFIDHLDNMQKHIYLDDFEQFNGDIRDVLIDTQVSDYKEE